MANWAYFRGRRPHMLLKDYYKTLEIGPAATEQEIKRSFRRLVLRFHPDKTGGDAVAETRFREIREAYEILSDPRQREEYNYKRWYSRSLGRHYEQAPLSPHDVLRECLQLYHYVRAVSGSRVDFDALSYHIRQKILSEANLRLLMQFNDRAANRQIVQKLMACCGSLPWRWLEPIGQLMKQAAGSDTALAAEIDDFMATHRQSSRWNRYRFVLVLLITLLICGLIYLASQ